MSEHVCEFDEQTKDIKKFLDDTGANLTGMTKIGPPAPAGFTIPAETCQAHLKSVRQPDELEYEISAHLVAPLDTGRVLPNKTTS